VMAQRLCAAGLDVAVVTPGGRVGGWSRFTEELSLTNAALIESGVDLRTNQALDGFDGETARLTCVFTGRPTEIPARSVVVVSARTPEVALYRALADDEAALADAGVKSVVRIGDCDAPALIAAAVYSGHKAARELGEATEVRSERMIVASTTDARSIAAQ